MLQASKQTESPMDKYLRPMSIKVVQDGADFYFNFGIQHNVPRQIPECMTAPFKVDDWDMKAAVAAREWFIAQMAYRFPNYTPVFE